MVESVHVLLSNPKLLDIIFADDIDLLHHLNDQEQDDLIIAITSTFAKWDMHIQPAKTEKYVLSKD